uniref:VWFA domain-containing protein n=1 Tax=Anopheles stephensi TaxID=30069 RepID=A0A182XXW0_ANOST
MTIIVFLVDTSASMCQRALVNGVQKTYLDIAKGAVETFLKFRQRSQDCMGDRYMLLTFEEPPNNVKAGWKENHATFMNELKNLQSTGLTTMGDALKNAFDLLNLNRMQSGIDTYGQGRCPFYLEPSVIIVLTDGGKYTFRNGVHQEIILPLQTHMPGTKLTKEPFRWDQRLFSLVLRMPGNRVEERADGKVPHDDSMIEKMCEVTGGRSYKIKSHYVLNQCIESLVQKVQPGVVIHFDQLISSNGSDSSTTDLQFQPTKRMIYVPKQHPSQKTFPVGYWPIPEPYWPDPKLTNLPPRDAHPKIKIISPSCDEPQVLRNFPIDKYELEASPLTLQILSKKESNKVWPLIVSTGLQGEMPFGYLKPNSTVPIVHLYVLPYNYQMLLPLINDLFHKFNLNPPNDWVYKFTNYVKTIPQYYCPFLRRALATTPNVPYQLVQYILPENLDSYLCPAVANYLKQMKNTAKIEQENLCLRVLKQLKQPKPAYHQLETAKLTVSQQTKRDLVSHPMLKDTFTKLHMEIANFDSYTIVVPSIIQTAATKNYRNPYDIPRRDLIDEIARMRENFFQLPTSGINVYTKDSGHCLPISDMGNYQEYLKNKETPLRELEPTNVRQHMFGNPYKKDKNMVMVDEADLNDLAPMKAGGGGLSGPHPGSSGGGGSGGGGTNSGTISLSGTSSSAHMKKGMDSGTVTRLARKRKAGPIRKDYVFKRSAKDMASSSSSGSIAGEDVHMSELLTDDESCSEFSGASDIEDDNEGCLVMALDTPEESAEVVVSVATVATTAASAAITAPQQQQQQQQPNEQRPAPQMRQQPAASQWSLDANDDMTDVMKISNILKTCHNGGDTERDKDAQTEDGAGERNSTGGTGTTNATPHDTTKTPDPNPVMVVANGFVSMMMNGGGGDNGSSSDPTVQPTLNWDYNFALYSCVEDEQELEQIEETNLKTRSIVFRDIRRPGRDYTQLLKHLELVQGSRSTQKHFVDACVHEARRFRRHRMVECIQEWWAQHTGRSAGNRRDGGKRARSKQQPGGGPNTFYIYGNSDGLLQDDQDNFFFPNDTGATVYGSKTFRSTTPPGPTYLNSGGGGGGDSTYGTTDFSHNNHHFVEVTHEPYPNS